MKLAAPVRHGRTLARLARPFRAGATSRSGVCCFYRKPSGSASLTSEISDSNRRQEAASREMVACETLNVRATSACAMAQVVSHATFPRHSYSGTMARAGADNASTVILAMRSFFIATSYRSHNNASLFPYHDRQDIYKTSRIS
jgi:hypothetical protein